MKNHPVSIEHRLRIASRCFAGFFGSFIFASSFSGLLSLLMFRVGWMSQSDSVHSMTLIAFLCWCLAGLWAFSIASLQKVWLFFVVTSVIFLTACWFLRV
jgi:hypothetical protein